MSGNQPNPVKQRGAALWIFLRLKDLLTNKEGAAALEFGFLSPVLIMILIGAFEFSQVMWVRNTLQYATERAGRFAMVNPSATNEELEGVVRANLPGLNVTGVTIELVNDSEGGTNYVTITLTYRYTFDTSFLPYGGVTLAGRSRVPLI